MGVAVRGGAESIVHTTQAKVAQNPDLCVLQIDFRNAFNEIFRPSFLEVVLLFKWVKWCYQNPSNLKFEDHILLSSRGVQQGDPLGPFLFCLALTHVISSISKKLPNLSHFWGDAGTLSQAFPIIVASAAEVGLTVNENKCCLWTRKRVNPSLFPKALEFADPAGFVLLGAPIGEQAFVESFVKKTVEKCCSLGTIWRP